MKSVNSIQEIEQSWKSIKSWWSKKTKGKWKPNKTCL